MVDKFFRNPLVKSILIYHDSETEQAIKKHIGRKTFHFVSCNEELK